MKTEIQKGGGKERKNGQRGIYSAGMHLTRST